MCEAPTGTGKTLAYIIAAIQRIKSEKKTTQVVILSHTIILATQILAQTRKIAEPLGISTTVCLGQKTGQRFIPNSQIVIATPKAFLSNFAPKSTPRSKTQTPALHSPADIKLIVIDEADYFYVDSENREDIKKIFKVLPTSTQKLLFTATLEDDVRKNMIKGWFEGKDPFACRTNIIMDNTIHTVYNCIGKGE